jgi:hypothetical protein
MTRSVESALKWESARSPRLQGRASRERCSVAGAGKWTKGLEKEVLMMPLSGIGVVFGSGGRGPGWRPRDVRTQSSGKPLGARKRV